MNNKIKNKYIEAPGKCIEADSRFEHVMAISLNPRNNYKDGITRCIMRREGNVQELGYIDRSELFQIKGDALNKFTITKKLKIKGEEDIIKLIAGEEWDFLGLEDPDIWIDEKTGLMHVYFTIAFKNKSEDRMIIGLGHAEGEGLSSLEMTPPVLMDEKGQVLAKELSIVPINNEGFRYNLFESSDIIDGIYYSTVKTAIVEDMGAEWKFGDTVFHPKEHQIAWIGEHASPGPLFPKSFIDVGENKLLGIMNGREASRRKGNHVKYGMFSIGLFIYDYEKGRITWVSPEPFIQDSEAKTITFASQFVETDSGSGILYAHVDDSFVRTYALTADSLKSFLPKD